MPDSTLFFACDEPKLEAGFQWAKQQALAYAHDSDPVGCWYEAALPGREAFCMRDVSHQAAGAHFLGLAQHTKNMLIQFAQGIAETRDWCSYWEITRYGSPAPVDYTNDWDFWYNLPANFDVMDACWRMYCLSGDREYLENSAFTNFYDRTVTDYISRWDHDGDGIPDRATVRSRRGIPSYDEQKGMEQMAVAADLIAAQCRGFMSYSKLRNASEYAAKARDLSALLSSKWWNKERRQFYGAMHMDGTMLETLGSPHLLAYFDAIRDDTQHAALLEQIHHMGEKGIEVEPLSHYPEIFFQHGQPERGMEWLYRLIDPELNRRKYPEASFAAIGAYVTGLFGLKANASSNTVTVNCHMPARISYLELTGCPLFGGCIDLYHDIAGTTLRNNTGDILHCQGQIITPGETKTFPSKQVAHTKGKTQ